MFIYLESLSKEERSFVEDLYREYGRKIYDMSFDVLKNQEDAKDAVSTVMMNIMLNIGKFMGKSRKEITSQIVIYSRNAAINIYRGNIRRMKKETVPVYSDEDGEENETGEIKDGGAGVEDVVFTRETARDVRYALKLLPCDCRDVLELRYIHGYSTDETAKLLGITPGAVCSRLYRAKKKLTELLREKP